MVMELGHLQPSQYSRAVTPSVEGRLRQETSPDGAHTNRAASTRGTSSTTVQRHDPQQPRRDSIERRVRDEQSAQYRHNVADSEREEAADAGRFGEHLAVVSRQARQSQSKRSYTPPALISNRGREANRRYLDASLANQPRFIDEIV